MLEAAAPERRTVYVSAISAVAGLAGGVGPLLGGAILTALAPVHFPAHGLIRNNYHVLFVLSGLLRSSAPAAAAAARGGREPRARYVLGQLKATKPVGSFTSIQRLSRADSAQARAAGGGELARLKTPVAVEELVKALDDVALPVREQAAVALGEIGDARATGPLVRKLTDPASGITPAAATALGKIGDRAALPSLAAAAQLGPPPRQLAAWRRWGGCRTRACRTSAGRDARTPIRACARRPSAPWPSGRTRAAPPALAAQLRDGAGAGDAGRAGRCAGAGGGAVAGAVPCSTRWTGRASPTVRREILNAVGSLLGGRDAFYPYLALDSYARDETVSKILMNIQRRYRAGPRRRRRARPASPPAPGRRWRPTRAATCRVPAAAVRLGDDAGA